ncbi:GrpB-like predicted nucleotidyltransferase (UPF0157 family) [Halanaerobium saccharolyticum]|uniref:GrpB-like predicted nucleotidyltransferase (UPF0157 family) n=1 Tax=Halanaerobium saccharolyticum TaxID=43595 RepID=A0A4R7Z837_9FIRM|nr:GrpB family protein [Halanaerobium saccharolyticum]RAK09740.1 GrpB-like predicted nucleotidyltransferase (UPF0157 family) [Halanaerobium saccharolyticum]TDW07302.1 GrpB-like predicted nucleotidyltransferase (UPF0157 family) [Halanaerobium saccharolyticum]TDX61181.1 GrpB-like predicted nucleotidyltransferase (UPF0157 family) [Halanaerobium saccharolyticum]
MLGLKYEQVKLKSHNKEWKTIFENEKDRIKNQINNYFCKIEHIGSTAIKSIPAKPIIDIMLALDDYSQVNIYIQNLGDLNYLNFGECGRKGRTFLVKEKNNETLFHLHLVEYENRYWEDNIFFRNYLQDNSETALEYAELKRTLAQKYRNNRNLYRLYKSEFVEKILKLKNN